MLEFFTRKLKKSWHYLYEKLYIVKLPFLVFFLTNYLLRSFKNRQSIPKYANLINYRKLSCSEVNLNNDDPEFGNRIARRYYHRIPVIRIRVKLRKQPIGVYNACELLINLLSISGRCPKRKAFRSIIIKLLFYIITHIEFRLNRTNNHIINNSRAIIIASIYLENRITFRLGLSVFEKFFLKLTTCEGTLDEGSTSYELVLALWLMDIQNICGSRLSKDCSKRVCMYINNINACYSNFNHSEVPRIGDCSPDSTFSLSYKILEPLNNGNQYYGNRNTGLNIFGTKNLFLCYWLQKIKLEPQNHQHNDSAQILIYKNNKAITSDPGRYSYKKNCKISNQQISFTNHSGCYLYFNKINYPLKFESRVFSKLSDTLVFKWHYGRLKRYISYDKNQLKVFDDFEFDEFLGEIIYNFVSKHNITVLPGHELDIGNEVSIKFNKMPVFVKSPCYISDEYGDLKVGNICKVRFSVFSLSDSKVRITIK